MLVLRAAQHKHKEREGLEYNRRAVFENRRESLHIWSLWSRQPFKKRFQWRRCEANFKAPLLTLTSLYFEGISSFVHRGRSKFSNQITFQRWNLNLIVWLMIRFQKRLEDSREVQEIEIDCWLLEVTAAIIRFLPNITKLIFLALISGQIISYDLREPINPLNLCGHYFSAVRFKKNVDWANNSCSVVKNKRSFLKLRR